MKFACLRMRKYEQSDSFVGNNVKRVKLLSLTLSYLSVKGFEIWWIYKYYIKLYAYDIKLFR